MSHHGNNFVKIENHLLQCEECKNRINHNYLSIISSGLLPIPVLLPTSCHCPRRLSLTPCVPPRSAVTALINFLSYSMCPLRLAVTASVDSLSLTPCAPRPAVTAPVDFLSHSMCPVRPAVTAPIDFLSHSM